LPESVTDPVWFFNRDIRLPLGDLLAPSRLQMLQEISRAFLLAGSEVERLARQPNHQEGSAAKMSSPPKDIKQNGVRQAQKALGQSRQSRRIYEEKFPKVFRSSPSVENHLRENCQNRLDERRWGTWIRVGA